MKVNLLKRSSSAVCAALLSVVASSSIADESSTVQQSTFVITNVTTNSAQLLWLDKTLAPEKLRYKAEFESDWQVVTVLAQTDSSETQSNQSNIQMLATLQLSQLAAETTIELEALDESTASASTSTALGTLRSAKTRGNVASLTANSSINTLSVPMPSLVVTESMLSPNQAALLSVVGKTNYPLAKISDSLEPVTPTFDLNNLYDQQGQPIQLQAKDLVATVVLGQASCESPVSVTIQQLSNAALSNDQTLDVANAEQANRLSTTQSCELTMTQCDALDLMSNNLTLAAVNKRVTENCPSWTQ